MSVQPVEKMSIQAGLYGLSFYIYNKGVEIIDRIPYTAARPEDLDRELARVYAENLAEFRPERLILLHQNALNTLVPASLFDPAKAAEYLKFNVPLQPTDTIEADTDLPFDTVNVYVPYENLNNFFIDKWGGVEYYHAASPFVIYASRRAEAEGTDVFVRFFTREFQMLIVKDGKLLFYNTFPYENTDDFLYYFFFAWEETQTPSDARIRLTGHTPAAWEARKQLEDFQPGAEVDTGGEKEILKALL
ncbi:MAG: DUF3822 family protein [Chlorobi bacterium]|nr:DUF3822 family protein [Chlorobiota bacterium]